MLVQLSAGDQELVRGEAESVYEAVVARNAKHSTLAVGDRAYVERSLGREIDWVGSEVAVACALGEDWVPRGARPWHGGDIVARSGEVIEVRHTVHRSGKLVVWPYDEDGRYLFLVVGEFPCYRVPGWLPVSIARLRAIVFKGWNARGPGVSQDRLWPVEGWNDFKRPS